MRFLNVCFLGLALTAVSCGGGDKKSAPKTEADLWKVGTVLVERQEPMNVIRLRSVSDTNEVKELRYGVGEWKDEWNGFFDEEQWEILEATSTPEYVVKMKGFSMMAPDEYGTLSMDWTGSVLSDANGIVLVTIYDLDGVTKAGLQEIKKAVNLVERLNEGGRDVRIALLTSARHNDETPMRTAQKWLSENRMEGFHLLSGNQEENNVYFTFYTDIKGMQCGNPGFMYLKNGVVMGKGSMISDLRIE